MAENIITEKPKVRLKGFKSENLRVIGASAEAREVARDIGEAMSAPAFRNLSARDQELVHKIKASYRRLLSEETLSSEDFVLSGHEMPEYAVVEKKDRLRYLTYRYKYNKYPELKIVDDYPPCLQIEPTSICNYRCIMCYQSDSNFVGKSKGYMGHMDIDMFKRIVDEIAGKVEAVTLASRGEPLLHKDIVGMLEYCRNKFLALKLNTNASILDERMIHALLSSDLQILVFSIDAADKEMYEKIRVRGNFEKVVKNLENFRDIRMREYSQSKMVVRISGVKLNAEQDIDDMEDFWGAFADIVAFTNYNPWQDSYENQVNSVDSACTELWRRMFVWWDGKVNPCDFDYKSTLSQWNFEKQTVSEAWISDAYNELRARHLNTERSAVEPCRRCVVT